MLQDLDYFDQQYQQRQDDAALDLQADGAADGFDNREAQFPADSAYMSGFLRGKLAKTELILRQCQTTLKSLKERSSEQQSRLNFIRRSLEIVVNRVMPEDGEF